MIQKPVRPNKYYNCKVLIHSQVRSHSTLVLPIVEGRSSLGSVLPCREDHQPIPTLGHPLMDFKYQCKQKYFVLQSIKNQPIKISSEKKTHPL
jgi:hypothetical protein